MNGGESQPDVVVQNEGSLFVFHLNTIEARSWVEEHVTTEPWQWIGGALTVEHRYARDLASGMQADGLLVQ
jgi:hypothetical protein